MPIYQYVCSKCNTNFELRQGFNDESVAVCPRCRGESRRLFIPVPIIFKGPGFYVTDSRPTPVPQRAAKGAEAEAKVTAPKATETSQLADSTVKTG